MGSKTIIGEISKRREKIIQDIAVREAALANGRKPEEWQLFVGNKDVFGASFVYLDRDNVADVTYPRGLLKMERIEYGDAFGFPVALKLKDGTTLPASNPGFFSRLQALTREVQHRRQEISRIEKGEIGKVNAKMESLRLDQKGLPAESAEFQRIDAKIKGLQAQYELLAKQSGDLRREQGDNQIIYRLATGEEKTMSIGKLVSFYYPNQLTFLQRLGWFIHRGWHFLVDDPREANTEGGVFPAIFGTCVMTLLMSVAVVPFGVVAAIYLREYARQGFFVRAVRISVNNLAGVPSIVFGVFGLGFFVYFVGGTIDEIFFKKSLPTPTFGTGGILWAALTLALMTVPVVIVATEEALSAVPRGMREASLACGASKWQTIQRIVLPSAVPGILTGLILAMARGAGEVAPLMLVGVVKLAPSLPIDGTWPFIHLERKFMHLGFHIYDLGFQSPDSEAAKPMVFATTLLLIVLVVLLNLGAIIIRERIRSRYRAGVF
jgi:phosphate transport system permease protein